MASMTLYERFAGKYIRYKTVASQPWITGRVLEREHEDPMCLYIERIPDPLDPSDPEEARVRFGYPGWGIQELRMNDPA